MKRKRDNLTILILLLVVVAAIGFLLNQQGITNKLVTVTGSSQTVSVPSTANIMSYFAIAAGGALATPGIVWTNIATLPATDFPADADYIGALNDLTDYYISVSSDSNINVDMCISANQPLTSGLNTIPLSGYGWAWNLLNDINNPSLASSTSMLTMYASAGTTITPGSNDYFRYWLDVPSGQAAGTYTNTINFKGVQTGQPC